MSKKTYFILDCSIFHSWCAKYDVYITIPVENYSVGWTMQPLASATCVLRRVDARLSQLTHVAEQVSAYLDVSVFLSIVIAAASRSSRLFDRVAVRVMCDSKVDPVLRIYWLSRAMEAAISNNDLATVQRIHELHPEPLDVRSLYVALKFGTLETVLWVVEHRGDRVCCQPGVRNLCRACVSSLLPEIGERDVFRVVQWLVNIGLVTQHGARLPSSLIEVVVRSAELVRWLHEQRILAGELVEMALSEAIVAGNKESVVYLLEKGCTLNRIKTKEVLISAAIRGYERIVDCLISSGMCDEFEDKFEWAATRPDGVKVLQWEQAYMTLKGDGVSVVGQMRFLATEFGNLDVLQWLYNSRGILPSQTLTGKVSSQEDCLEIYQWMHKTGIGTWSTHDMDDAASRGHFDVVVWLYEHRNARCTAKAMDGAASNGHLEVVQWLHINRNESCTPSAIDLAACNGHLAIVQWLHENCEHPCRDTTFESASSGGHLEVVMWLYENCIRRCTPRRRHLQLLGTGPKRKASIDVLRWLRLHSTQIHNERFLKHMIHESDIAGMMTSAAHQCDLLLLEYLYEHYYKNMSQAASVMSEKELIRCCHLGVIQWLYKRFQPSYNWNLVRRLTSCRSIAVWLDSVHELC